LFQLQPSEFAKLAFILAMANFLSRPPDEVKRPSIFWKAIGLLLLPFALILKEPDLGSALVLLPTGLAMMFVAGIPARFLAQLLGAAFHADVDDIRHVEFPDRAQFDIERLQTGDDGASLFNGGVGSHRQRARRKHADVRVRIAARNYLQPQIVEVGAERVGKIDYQCVEALWTCAIGFGMHRGRLHCTL